MSVLDEPLRFDKPTLLAAGAPGRVTLVGAGPGDPDLLTVKAYRAIGRARVVLHDALVGEGVLDLIPRSAYRIDVGKQCGHHKLSQAGITELMVRLARSGQPVLRLKGGDPFIFGRGGEECEVLAAEGIPFEVIPGLSAAQGAAASAMLPLTHRDHASTLIFATAHLRDGAGGAGGERGERGAGRAPDLDWDLLARPRQTVVFYMGVGSLGPICEQLVAHGLPADTPAATVERATRHGERTVVGTLATLPARARAQGVQPPALIVVGQVVALQPALAAAMSTAAAATASSTAMAGAWGTGTTGAESTLL